MGLWWRGALSGGFNSFSLGSRWFLGFRLSCLVRFVCFLFWYGSIFYVRLMSRYLFSSFILVLLVSFVVGVGGVSLAVFHWLAFLLGLDLGGGFGFVLLLLLVRFTWGDWYLLRWCIFFSD